MARQAIDRFAAVTAGALVLGAVLVSSAVAFTSWGVNPTPNPGVYGNLYKGVAVAGVADAWAVGGSAAQTSNVTLAAHWNGSTWTPVATPTPGTACQDGNIQWTGNPLNAVAAVSSTDVWAVGQRCYAMRTLVEHWNGSAWTVTPSPSIMTGGDGIQNILNGVAVASPTSVWAVGTHTAVNGQFQTLVESWNGTSWNVVASPSPSPTANVLYGVAATGPADVWAVGYARGTSASQTLIEHWNGTSWSVVASPARPAGSVLSAVTAISPTDVWAVGSEPAASGASVTLVEHWNGSAWSVVPSPNLDVLYGSANVLRGITAVSATDIWAVGMFQNAATNYHQHRTLTLHWNGTSWSVVTSPTPGQSGELNAVAKLPNGGVLAAGLSSIYPINIYDGTYTAPRTLVLAG